MITTLNEYQQPIGFPLPDWTPATLPGRTTLAGRYCRVEPLNIDRHGIALYEAYSQAADGRDWSYLFAGPFDTWEAYRDYLSVISKTADPLHYAVIDLATGRAVGTLALMRIDVANGVIEVGHVCYSPLMKRTRVSTETMALMLKYVFDELKFRRLEWKCHSLNAPSRAAASRFGFRFEGVFRQAVIARGRNRDTAWYSIIDSEYPELIRSYEQWLDTSNFDALGQQREKLTEIMIRNNTGQTAI